jgi:hypothetical protein
VTFKLDDYVDVAERIRLFYERFPDGSLRSAEKPWPLEVDGKTFLIYHARAYRTPDDKQPADGWAWEPIPGPTPYTKDSELMNAETAAWGRAIIAAGIPSKKIASAEEVRNRSGNSGDGSSSEQSVASSPETDGGSPKKPELIKKLTDILAALSAANPQTDWKQEAKQVSVSFFQKETVAELTKPQLESLIAETEKWLVAANPPDDGIPFG